MKGGNVTKIFSTYIFEATRFKDSNWSWCEPYGVRSMSYDMNYRMLGTWVMIGALRC